LIERKIGGIAAGAALSMNFMGVLKVCHFLPSDEDRKN
jgi:hypothetical protein